MAVKRYNGTSWDTVAGLGAQGAAATSSSITTWVKTAAGGETSLTGSSDSSTTLAYTPGQEQVFINGVLQVRGSDYTATNGTSITGLTALVAGDIATVTTVNAFSVTGAVPLSTVTANGDLIVGTSSGAVGRLGVGSTGQVLTVSGGVPTWASASATAISYTLLNAGGTSLSGSSTTVSGLSGYNYLMVWLTGVSCTTGGNSIRIALNNVENNNVSWSAFTLANTTPGFSDSNNGSFLYCGSADAGQTQKIIYNVEAANSTGVKPIKWIGTPSSQDANSEVYVGQGYDKQASVVSSITVKGGTFDAGTMFVYGAN